MDMMALGTPEVKQQRAASEPLPLESRAGSQGGLLWEVAVKRSLGQERSYTPSPLGCPTSPGPQPLLLAPRSLCPSCVTVGAPLSVQLGFPSVMHGSKATPSSQAQVHPAGSHCGSAKGRKGGVSGAWQAAPKRHLEA